MSLKRRLKDLGYDFQPSPLEVLTFHAAVRAGNLIFTSGQISKLGEQKIVGKVGSDIDIQTAIRAAEICAFNCICAAGAIIDIDSIIRPVKVLGMVNVAAGFNNTSEVIHGCSKFYNQLFGNENRHARSAVGMVLPGDWAVEVETVFEVRT
jgi:enamine deaminase RidA (YjgF/YER057c/UK114 family)